ncbi:MAG TPA: hypothetical protein VNM14_13105 [Planctomycetota bacterium]|nr:hypothetical protein [Planctomycetota bacterium]
MYIRSNDEALQYLAEILDIPDRREQIMQSTICTLLCLEVEPRLFLADCQAFLIEGGLESLRARRRGVIESREVPIALLDRLEDARFEEVASALDALHFTEVVRRVFPELRADRWQIARALLLYESGVRTQVTTAVKARGNPDLVRTCREAVEGMIVALRPGWGDRLGAIRTACLETLKKTSGTELDRLHEEAERLFELFAVSDSRAPELLAAIDADMARASEQIVACRDLAAAAQVLLTEPPPTPPDKVRDVA